MRGRRHVATLRATPVYMLNIETRKSSEHGARSSEHGAWSTELVARSTEIGAWSRERSLLALLNSMVVMWFGAAK